MIMQNKMPMRAIIAVAVVVLGLIIFAIARLISADSPQGAAAGADERAAHMGGAGGANRQSQMGSGYDPNQAAIRKNDSGGQGSQQYRRN